MTRKMTLFPIDEMANHENTATRRREHCLFIWKSQSCACTPNASARLSPTHFTSSPMSVQFTHLLHPSSGISRTPAQSNSG